VPWVRNNSGLNAVSTHSKWFEMSILTENVNSSSERTSFELAQYPALPELAALDLPGVVGTFLRLFKYHS
jgi:hypothetical protein